jgi:hypothetical protein
LLTIFLFEIPGITSIVLVIDTLESAPQIILTLFNEGIPVNKGPVLNTVEGGGGVGNNGIINRTLLIGVGDSFNSAVDLSLKLWSD